MCLLREVSLITVAFAWVVLAINHKRTRRNPKETNPTITNSRLKDLKRFEKLKIMPQTPQTMNARSENLKTDKTEQDVYRVIQRYLNIIFVEKTLLPVLNNYDKITSLFNKLVVAFWQPQVSVIYTYTVGWPTLRICFPCITVSLPKPWNFACLGFIRFKYTKLRCCQTNRIFEVIAKNVSRVKSVINKVCGRLLQRFWLLAGQDLGKINIPCPRNTSVQGKMSAIEGVFHVSRELITLRTQSVRGVVNRSRFRWRNRFPDSFLGSQGIH